MENSFFEILKKNNYFDPKWYSRKYCVSELENNSSIKESDFFDVALKHYLEKGWKLGFDPSEIFSTSGYLYCNGDVKNSGINPLVHYIEAGTKENRWCPPSQPLPSFSVIMATYNRKNFIANSLNALLNQKANFPIDYEIVVADDGSTDGTSEYLRNLYAKEIASKKIVIVELPHNGVCCARNMAVEHSRFNWICYVDDDNVVRDNYISTFFESILKNPFSEFFYAQHFLTKEKTITEHEFDRSQLLKGNYIDLGVICHSKDIFYRVGCFDETLKRLVDWDLILRITAVTNSIYVPIIVMDYNSSNEYSRISNTVFPFDSFNKIRSKNKIESDIYSLIDRNQVEAEKKISATNENLYEQINVIKSDVEDRITKSDARIGNKIDQTTTDLENRITQFDKNNSNKFEQINEELGGRITEVNLLSQNSINRSNAELNNRISDLRKELSESRLIISTLITSCTLLKYKLLKSLTVGNTHKKYRDLYKMLKKLKNIH